jgi:hypothetical protein
VDVSWDGENRGRVVRTRIGINFCKRRRNGGNEARLTLIITLDIDLKKFPIFFFLQERSKVTVLDLIY